MVMDILTKWILVHQVPKPGISIEIKMVAQTLLQNNKDLFMMMTYGTGPGRMRKMLKRMLAAPLLLGLLAPGAPPSIYFLISGELTIDDDSSQTSLKVKEGECFGVRETLAGTPWAWRSTATRPSIVLQLERERLFELLAARIDLLQCIFGELFHRD